VLNLATKDDPALAARLARGIFAKPGVYSAIVRFGNADPKINSDYKPDLRSLSFSVDLAHGGTTISAIGDRQDFHCKTPCPCPSMTQPHFSRVMKVLTASNLAVGLWSVSLKDKLRTLRAITLAQLQSQQPIKAYQQLRYWSNVPFRHAPIDVVQYSATPSQPTQRIPYRRATRKLCRMS
jgi:hypothetical protein